MSTSRTIPTFAALALAACTISSFETTDARGMPASGASPTVGCFSGDAPVQTTAVRPLSRGASYDWPLRPFDQQHPVRGFFNDPRDAADGSHSFHFGIDIAAADGTPVYAIRAGTVYLSSARAVAVADRPGHVFSYWHVVPVVRHHQYVRRHQLLGHVEAPWKHVHFAELVNGRYVNPLRPGGLGPYRDATAPRIRGVDAHARNGRLHVVVDAFDMPPTSVPAPWHGLPVTPALVRWRLVRESATPSAWRMGVDFTQTLLPAGRFRSIYGPRSKKNAPGRPGRYCLVVARGVVAPPGEYRLEIEASDTGGNTTVAVSAVRIPAPS